MTLEACRASFEEKPINPVWLPLHRIDLVSDVLPFGRLWYAEPDSIEYAKSTGAHDAVIHVHDDGGNVIETHEHAYPARTRSTIKLRHVGQRGAKSI
jgi:hypothetical protein